MEGKFVTANTDLEVRTTNIQVVEIGDLALNWCFKNVEIVNK